MELVYSIKINREILGTNKTLSVRLTLQTVFYNPILFCGRSELQPAQPQGIHDDRYGAEAHGCRSDYRTKQDTEPRIEQTGSNRDPQRVVDESEEQVLLDVSHGGAAQ